MTKPLEKQTVAELRKAATKKKARVCGAPSKMKKAELIHFLREGKGGGTKRGVAPGHKAMQALHGGGRVKVKVDDEITINRRRKKK